MAASAVIQSPGPARVLLIMAKQPMPGATKTRLVPPLSPQQAAALYECFLRDTIHLARRVPEVHRVVAYSPPDARGYFAGIAPGFEYYRQRGPDLGTRLEDALTYYLSLGYRQVAAMNSDGPTLPTRYLIGAFRALNGEADVVLGPSQDGGYYLIGLKHPAPCLLREVRMSTPHVTTDTLTLAAEEGLKVTLLPTWYDVDDAQSLARLKAELATALPEFAPHTRAFLRGHR